MSRVCIRPELATRFSNVYHAQNKLIERAQMIQQHEAEELIKAQGLTEQQASTIDIQTMTYDDGKADTVDAFADRTAVRQRLATI